MSTDDRGPCQLCGAMGYSLSIGGPTICPSCDCGIPPAETRSARELSAWKARAEAAEAALAAARAEERERCIAACEALPVDPRYAHDPVREDAYNEGVGACVARIKALGGKP